MVHNGDGIQVPKSYVIPEKADHHSIVVWMGEYFNDDIYKKVELASIAYFGRCRHRAGSVDWIAHNHLWESCVTYLYINSPEILDTMLEDLQSKGFKANFL